MIRRFKGNNAIKGRIIWQMKMFVNNGAIKFENGEKRNTCIIIIDESKIPQRELNYLYTKLIPNHKGREIRDL